MDSVIFHSLARQLDEQLCGSRIDRVVQPGAGSLLLKLWTGRRKLQLLLKAEDGPAFYLTEKQINAPATPPRFCQLLRARLKSLLQLRAEAQDRILHLLCSGGEGVRYDLVFEGFGGRGNLLLVDSEGQIIDLLYRQEGTRALLPGRPYLLPRQRDRVSLFAEPALVVESLKRAGADGLAPMSPALAHALSAAAATCATQQARVRQLQECFSKLHFTPCRVSWGGRSGALPFLPESALFDRVEPCDDLSTLVEMGAVQAAHEQSESSACELKGRFLTAVARQRKRLQKRLQQIGAEQARQADPERFKIIGDLLLANLHLCKRGLAAVEVTDYFASPPCQRTIELDPRLSPQDNAARYFRKFSKASRAGDHHQRRLRQTAEELEWLDRVELALDEVEGGDDLYQVQEELAAAGLLKQTVGQLGRRAKVGPADALHKAVTPGGWQLLWGRNSRSNDYVSTRLTEPQDLWFHALNMPGAHLVLKCGKRVAEVAEQDILCAAAYAAGYSKGKGAGKIEVIVAQGREVKKPKGARPGRVSVESYRSVLVAPLRLDGQVG
jgi:predicted ribosome quality control (RQC) complex YloA/Tae2 family protein